MHPDAHVLIGDSAPMQALRASIARFAGADFPVLIEGESGTGKERVAMQIHRRSPGAPAGFQALNCAAFSPELLEAQLFGCARGAWTGADRDRPGLLEELGTGTLFLDEVGEMSPALQVKLLRVLESGDYFRLGETRPRLSRARILAATNRDLRTAVAEGRFRADLYHRLGVLRLAVPPLRVRGEDWRALLVHFRALHRDAFLPFSLSPAAEAKLAGHAWPGNVRELRNVVVRLGMECGGGEAGLSVLAEVLGESEPGAGNEREPTALLRPGLRLEQEVADFEQRLIRAALARCHGNLSLAARLLGANRTTLYGKLARHGIPLPTTMPLAAGG